jgi:biopolymer transport protein ExbB
VSFKRAAIAVLICLVPVVSYAAGSWWNADWKFRKEISLDLSATGADIAGTVQDAPVLVRLSLANFNYFTDANPDGSDFRVLDGDDKTPLKFHFERYDSQNQMIFLWVAVPRLTGGAKSDKIYVYYGNSSAPAASDPAGTFDALQALVLEFSQGDGLPVDATAYKNNPTASTAEPVAASLIAGGTRFSGAQTLTVPSSPSLKLLPNQGLTESAWVKTDFPQKAAYVMALADDSRELALGIDGTHAFARYSGGTGAPVTVTQSNSELSSGDWHYLALTAAAGQLTLYVDGVAAGQASVTLVEIGGKLTVGSGQNGNFLAGEVDSVGVSKAARSAEWLKAIARSEGTSAPLVVYGADGQKETGGQGSYLLTILKNLTVDGWVVIVICMTMLAIALVIMLLKAIYLSRVERANNAFLRDYHDMAGNVDAGALDQKESKAENEFDEDAPAMAALVKHEGKYGISTLYSLYHLGIAELNKRMAGQSAGAQRTRILSPQSIEAIRASMDATLTRLQQRLSGQMVLLTIAISGGPFLGLLGTVIGVMITFAAIAASGDVNVNAIAPGTAAALAATVAGLSVAIPCLFGYNWLGTRIKAIAANNRVFLDEFVARLAEQYS